MLVPWIKMSPSSHIVLAHSAELIEGNDHKGFLNLTEFGIEANKKFLKQYRINYLRKTNQHENLSDCINRLWDKSEPIVKNICDRTYCSHCKIARHTVRSCLDLKKALTGCNTEINHLILLLTY